jgi:hypothetical protein
MWVLAELLLVVAGFLAGGLEYYRGFASRPTDARQLSDAQKADLQDAIKAADIRYDSDHPRSKALSKAAVMSFGVGAFLVIAFSGRSVDDGSLLVKIGYGVQVASIIMMAIIQRLRGRYMKWVIVNYRPRD